jgi:hypothetical protein
MLELKITELKPGEYQLTFDIQPLADKLGIPKDKLAELIADGIMKLLFPRETSCEQSSFPSYL